jgi:hypothetical protein
MLKQALDLPFLRRLRSVRCSCHLRRPTNFKHRHVLRTIVRINAPLILSLAPAFGVGAFFFFLPIQRASFYSYLMEYIKKDVCVCSIFIFICF